MSRKGQLIDILHELRQNTVDIMKPESSAEYIYVETFADRIEQLYQEDSCQD